MPTTLQSPKGTRCIRCATLIRNSRPRCPSCDLDLTAPIPQKGASGINAKAGSGVGAAVSPGAGSDARPKPRTAKAGMKLCPACMNSVVESEMAEANGQMVCHDCATKLKNKPARGPAPAVIAAAPVHAPVEAAPAPAHAGGLPAKPIMGEGELLTAKGMQRQLMDKLFWIKVLVIIWGIVNMTLGGLAYAAGALGSAFVGAIGDDTSDSFIDDDDFTDENGNKMSKEQIAAERAKIREQSAKLREEANSQLFKLKLVAAFSVFIGIAFFAAFFLMNSKPYEVCMAIMVMYVLVKILDFAFGEFPGLVSIFVTLSVLATLFEGIRTGYRIKDIRARAEAATGVPHVA